MTTDDAAHRSEAQARAQLNSIREMVAALHCDYDRLQELRDERDAFEFDPDANAAPDGPGYANDRDAWAAENPADAEELKQLEEAAGECEDADKARERIKEDALSVQVRSDWSNPGEELTPGEYMILLCTGGPACRIVGDLNRGEPSSARVEYQDWGTPWTELPTDSDDEATLLAYACCFFFGE